MFVSYLTEANYTGLDALYPYDNNVNFQNIKLNVDGRLSINISPVFSDLKDFKKNNYSLIYLTKQTNLSKLTDFYHTPQDDKTIVGKIFHKTSTGSIKFLKFDAIIDDQEFLSYNYDQSFNPVGDQEPLNIFHFIKKDSIFCNVMYFYKENEYYLNFNPVTFNINFTTLSAFNELKDYTRNFYYVRDEDSGILALQCRINGLAYRVIYDQGINRLSLSALSAIPVTDTRGLFYLTAFKGFDSPEITIDWGSYEKKFNQNDLTIDNTRSFFDTKNNFLLHCEHFNFDYNQNNLPYNILSLKTQLNAKNISSRGNFFSSEDSITNRDYVSIFSGGRQEQGHDKLTLQYQTYTHPYEFRSGKTTWFHTPQSMWPYERLNINHTTLIEAGAVGGDHPLRSDKVFKKLGNYKQTANFGNTTSEQTGQWLCSWLSAAPDIKIRPVWVDRFYNPSKLTPYQALSASPGSVIYNSSYNCYLNEGIYDVPSSLTFEPGNLYAYTHIGKVDALENIKSLTPFLQQKNFTEIKKLDGRSLQPTIEDSITTYDLHDDEVAEISVNNFKNDLNRFSISFWAARDDWSTPCGFQLAGNYTDYGLGIFNYEAVNPLLMFVVKDKILSYNSNLDLVNIYSATNIEFNLIDYFCRRDPLNSFHLYTSLSSVFELNLQEAIIDSAALSGRVQKLYNNKDFAYFILDNNTAIFRHNLLTNELVLTGADIFLNLKTPNGSYSPDTTLTLTDDNKIVLLSTFQGTDPRCFNNTIFFLSSVPFKKDSYGNFIVKPSGILMRYDTNSLTDTFSSVTTPGTYYNSFNVDKYNNIWCASGNNIDIYGQYSLVDRKFTVPPPLSTFNTPYDIMNISFADNFVNGNLEESIFLTCSGINKGLESYFVSRIDSNGDVLKTVYFETDKLKVIEPCNYNFNQKFLYSKTQNYTFKARLFNQFDTEDTTILNLPIKDVDLTPGYHHFTITVDCLYGRAQLYLDGEVYCEQNFAPGKFVFSNLLEDNILIGATPFYNSSTLDNFLTKNTNLNYYTIRSMQIQNFYWFNTILNYCDVGMLYKEKIQPDTLVWDVPSGRRNYNETVSRFFKNKVPGAKSTVFNVYVNSSTLDESTRAVLEPSIINSISKVVPGYTKLNKLIWTTNLPQLSSATTQPYYPGNVLTNAGLER